MPSLVSVKNESLNMICFGEFLIWWGQRKPRYSCVDKTQIGVVGEVAIVPMD